MKSKITKRQKKELSKIIRYAGQDCRMVVSIRYDDSCGNGHNTFSITGQINSMKGIDLIGGCLHKEIEKYFPELKHLIKWHLCSSDGPVHYIANTLYFSNGRKEEFNNFVYLKDNALGIDELLGIFDDEKIDIIKFKYGTENIFVKTKSKGYYQAPNIESARNSAIWEDATLEQLRNEKALMDRLPSLLAEFKKDIESLGFIY